MYLYLLRHGRAMGVREIQKALDFSSPSVAFHHLDKLVELGWSKRPRMTGTS